MAYPRIEDPPMPILINEMFQAPLGQEEARAIKLVKGPNVGSIPPFDPLPDDISLPVLLVVGDNISTDEILPAARVLPSAAIFLKSANSSLRRSIQAIHSVQRLQRADILWSADRTTGRAPAAARSVGVRFLGLRAVIAQSFAQESHWQNLVNFGVLPLAFVDPDWHSSIAKDDILVIERLYEQLTNGSLVRVAKQNSIKPL